LEDRIFWERDAQDPGILVPVNFSMALVAQRPFRCWESGGAKNDYFWLNAAEDSANI